MSSTRIPALLGLYRNGAAALDPLLPIWVNRRAKQGKEDPQRKTERYGIASQPRPEGPLIWMHGASVGECTMLLPLITKFRQQRPDISILITSATCTAAAVLKERLPEGCVHQYVPLDSPKNIGRFLDHWHPDLAIWAESEIWPNMIINAQARGIKMALINARMSEKSLNGWAKHKTSAEAIFSRFDVILAADKRTGDSLGWFTARDIPATGNLKDAAPPLPANMQDLARFQNSVKDRPIWCAASTHSGEDEIILRAHKDVVAAHPNALLILAPRHPERRDEILKLIQAADFNTAIRSQNDSLSSAVQVYLFDTIGEMGLAYRLSALTFVCGSLKAELSGHNPLEPARLRSAVMTGGHIASFADIYNTMFKFNAARRILSPEIIGKDIAALLSAPDELAALQDKAARFAESRNDVLSYVWSQLKPLLPESVS